MMTNNQYETVRRKIERAAMLRQGPGVVYHDGTWNGDELQRMANGELLDRNGKRYGICRGCRTVIRLDKPIFGSYHFCG